jgi:hypothetical protein
MSDIAGTPPSYNCLLQAILLAFNVPCTRASLTTLQITIVALVKTFARKPLLLEHVANQSRAKALG